MKAESYGAVGALVRSVASHTLGTPHTNMLNCDNGSPSIPVACITIEDAELLDRLQSRGQKLTIWMRMLSDNEGNVITRNVISDYTGWKFPMEYVLVGGILKKTPFGKLSISDFPFKIDANVAKFL